MTSGEERTPGRAVETGDAGSPKEAAAPGPGLGPPGTDAKAGKGGTAAGGERLRLAAIGLEAELSLVLDGREARPEDVFGDPRAFIRAPLMHRTGTSYHLPTGGAIYFDTGVMELATPVIEVGRGCAARAGRSLWEALHLVREELDAWQEREGRDARLVGFSTHYNVSFDRPPGRARNGGVEDLAWLLAHVLPVPVMLLATNRRSTGVGVRPRGDRIEITADFTPSAALMIATATLITGIVREVMTWRSYDLAALRRRADVPVVAGYEPMPHTSRKGWLARHDTYPRSPFEADVDGDLWETTDGESLTLRQIARRITASFWPSIRRLSDPFTFRLIASVMRGTAPSLLDLDDRPPEYEDVGRLCTWDDLFSPDELDRSRYERVLIHAIAGRRLRIDGAWHTPVGMRGWSTVAFRREGSTGRRHLSIDYLLGHLDEWEEPRRRR